MRLLLIVLALVLVGCKPDPIEACVEAEKKRKMRECERDNGYRRCSPKTEEALTIDYEPDWRRKCMRAAAGKED
jgi:hypothetical protein